MPESNLGSSVASGALSCTCEMKNACPASEGTRGPRKLSERSFSLKGRAPSSRCIFVMCGLM
eukprot:5956756-Prymnesium_polylepis.1